MVSAAVPEPERFDDMEHFRNGALPGSVPVSSPPLVHQTSNVAAPSVTRFILGEGAQEATAHSDSDSGEFASLTNKSKSSIDRERYRALLAVAKPQLG